MTSEPVRIQRKRTKGWKMPENTVAVTRPLFWGNPFTVGHWHKIGNGQSGTMSRVKCWEEKHAGPDFEYCPDNAKAVDLYRRYITLYPRDTSELRGKNLACWCKIGDPCHADILLEIANAPAETAQEGK